MRFRVSPLLRKSALKVTAATLLAGAATGCSSDVLRFQDGYYNANSDQMTTGAIPQPHRTPVPMADVGNGGGTAMASAGSSYPTYPASSQVSSGGALAQPFPPAPSNGSSMTYDATRTGSINGSYGGRSTSPIPPAVQGGALPPLQPALAPSASAAAASPRSMSAKPFPAAPANGTQRLAAAPAAAAATATRTPGWSASGATAVTLKEGETIYTLAHRYGVPATAIMKANGIADASRVAPGQKIAIPAYSYASNAPVSAPDNDPKTRAAGAGRASAPVPPDRAPQPMATQAAAVAVRPEANASQAVAAAGSGKSYTVQSGDTLTKISRKTGVSIDAIKQANGLSTGSIRVGQVLALSGSGSAPARASSVVAAAEPDRKTITASTPAPAEVKPVQTASVAARSNDPKPASYAAPTPARESVAEVEDKAETASIAPESTGIGKLRWPARGQIISSYGADRGGSRNDGIDISVPEGTPIKSAENGVVIYAGNGLKEYGNTVLVRHDNGLVTVYGNAKDLKVNRGDKVTRGQVIAESGMSGSAERPQLHFEVRKDSRPVNPTGYLD